MGGLCLLELLFVGGCCLELGDVERLLSGHHAGFRVLDSLLVLSVGRVLERASHALDQLLQALDAVVLALDAVEERLTADELGGVDLVGAVIILVPALLCCQFFNGWGGGCLGVGGCPGRIALRVAVRGE